MFSESLTVRIIADTAEFDRQFSQVEDRIRRLGSFGGVGNLFGNLGGATRNLNSIGRLLSRISSQIRDLSNTTITLNTSPAIRSLSGLLNMIQRVQNALNNLSATPVSIPIPSFPGIPSFPLPVPTPFPTPTIPTGPTGPIRTFAGGGLVTGPSGIDRIPAMLTAGEFVLTRSAVEQLGSSTLDGLNRSRNRPGALTTTASTTATTNNFGEITINVAESSGINNIVRDLRLHGFRLRNRRG